MALTSGFFNSKNHDRKYDATQISTLFEGLIKDGVYQGVGNIFKVSASSGMNVTVDTGRAWFNNTWTRNDAKIVLTVSASEQILNRIDAVVLEVNNLEDVRSNSIKIVKGTPASSPAKPSLTKNDNVHQYPLAYITVDANVTAITQQKIQNAVGTSACPFVTGIIDTIDVDDLITQWSSEFDVLFAELEGQISQAIAQTIIDKSVTEPKIADNAVITRTIKDGAVTRAKLANDALFSPVVTVSANRNIAWSDFGKTLLANYSSTAATRVLTLTQANSADLPIGFEFAVCRMWNYSACQIKFSGLRVTFDGKQQFGKADTKSVNLPDIGSMVALKKFESNSSNGDVWLITGNVEVVT